MEFKDIKPQNPYWTRQKAIYGFHSSVKFGSLISGIDAFGNTAYCYEIEGYIADLPDECKTWEEAESVFLEIMFDYFDEQEGYYNNLKHICDKLIQERN